MIALPTKNGWFVSWYTGEVKTLKYKDGRTKEIRMKDEYTSTSKAKVIQKAEELKAQGFEIEMVTECIF